MENQKTYLMSNSKGHVKIGKSSDPIARKINLCVGDPTIELLGICDEDIEIKLQIKYKDYAVGGEWFSLNNKQIIEIVQTYNFRLPEDITNRQTNINLSKEEINPFTNELIIVPGRRMVDYNKYSKDKDKYDKGKTIPHLFLESADKISIYTSPGIRSVICTLSGSASKLLLWLQQSVDYNMDLIKFNTKRFLKETEMSFSTFQKAKEELINNKIISLKKDDKKYWWINPAILFKGSRTKKYPNNIVIFKSTNSILNSDSKINEI